MTPAPWFLWDLAGQPQHPAANSTDVLLPCVNCGHLTGRTVPVKLAVGPNYDTATATRSDSSSMCEPCAWAFAGKPPATLRMWTVVARTDLTAPPSNPRCALNLGPWVHLTNRSDMRHVAQTLTDPPDGEWLVSVATSGHKQVVPYAHTNHGIRRWSVRVEGHSVSATPSEFRTVLAAAAAIRAAGASAASIAAAAPNSAASARELRAWHQHALTLAPYRDAALLALIASFLIKDHVDDYASRYPTH